MLFLTRSKKGKCIASLDFEILNTNAVQSQIQIPALQINSGHAKKSSINYRAFLTIVAQINGALEG